MLKPVVVAAKEDETCLVSLKSIDVARKWILNRFLRIQSFSEFRRQRRG